MVLLKREKENGKVFHFNDNFIKNKTPEQVFPSEF